MAIDQALNKDRRGFVLSGIALLLILPAMLIASSLLVVVWEGAEATSIQATADKVSYTAWHVKDTVRRMELYDMPVDNSTLDDIEEKYESSTGLSVELVRSDNIVYINVQDSRGAAQYSTTENLAKI